MQKPAAGASSEFRIYETNEFIKALKKLPSNESAILERKLRNYVYPQLRVNPYIGLNIKKLKGYAPETWRYPIGDFRVFYHVDSKGRIVLLFALNDRRDAYK